MRTLKRMPAPAPAPTFTAGPAAKPARRADPAPSRVAYRLHRLWLTPRFRLAMRLVAPLLLTFLAGAWYLSDDGRRGAISASMADLRRSVAERPEFMIKLMAIDGASPEVEALIRDTFPVDFPISSFELDLEVMQAEIADFDQLESAALRIRPGGVLQVSVTERKPAVVWRSPNGLVLLDAAGNRIADLAHRTQRPDLPLIAGRGAEGRVGEALALIRASGPLAARLRGIVLVGQRRWDLVLSGGQRVALPEQDPQTALQQVIALDQAQDLLGRAVTQVDMRNPLRPTLRLAPEAAEAMHRIKAAELGETRHE